MNVYELPNVFLSLIRAKSGVASIFSNLAPFRSELLPNICKLFVDALLLLLLSNRDRNVSYKIKKRRCQKHLIMKARKAGGKGRPKAPPWSSCEALQRGPSGRLCEKYSLAGTNT
jgi:hypothetical protein